MWLLIVPLTNEAETNSRVWGEVGASGQAITDIWVKIEADLCQREGRCVVFRKGTGQTYVRRGRPRAV